MMSGEYEFIFLDGPKAQYEKYLPDLKRLLKKGGTLFSDDVLLYGWVDGREPTPWKRHVIVDKLRSYLQTISSDRDFSTSVLDVGDGVAISVLINKENEGYGIGRNEKYIFDIKITRKGTNDPDKPVSKEDIDIIFNIEKWNEKEDYGVIF
jgi:hypothetical protein